MSVQFLKQNAFFICSSRFLNSQISNSLEKSEFILEKMIGIPKTTGKVRKYINQWGLLITIVNQ